MANCAGGGYKDQDRTEPPVGAKVLLSLYERFGDRWLVELLFDDALDWSDWFLRMRVLPGHSGLISLRSFDERAGSPGGMQEARYESGLDNSPMYDCGAADQGDGCEYFNRTSGVMELLDVGMSAMAAQEAYALATLADAIGRPEGAMLRARGDAYRDAIRSGLWDGEASVYANKMPLNASLSNRISPTSFYPLMLTSVTGSDDQRREDARADAMMRHWLTSPTVSLAPRGPRCECWRASARLGAALLPRTCRV